MNAEPNRRHRLSAVYLSDTERDLIVQALDLLGDYLAPATEQHNAHSKVTKFARSYTAQRVEATRLLFIKTAEP